MTHILIVDDLPQNLYMLRVLLEGHGFSVTDAPDGAAAMADARRIPPDLIISDLLMPVVDGFSMLRQWRADDRLKHLPFIVFTATYTKPQDERLAMALGADAFLIKPAEPEAIIACVRGMLARRAAGTLPSAMTPQLDQKALLHDYNAVLLDKLEKKIVEADRTNLALRHEIAERRQAEARLRLRDRAIQAVGQGILISDHRQRDNPIIYASAGFERLTGYLEAEVIGRDCRMLQGPDTDPATVQIMREAIAAGRSCAVEILNYRKDGTTFWNELSLNPVHDQAGILVHYVGVQNDITQRRKLEAELLQAKKMEAIGQLAGGVAHDFNNHLTVIIGCSEEVLAQPDLPAALREPAEAIALSGAKAAELTRQLLTFSRQTLLRPKVIDLNVKVAETARMLGRLISADIVFTARLSPVLSRVRVDPVQLDQVLMNLVVNARDAMPNGGHLMLETANVVLDELYAATHLNCRPGAYAMLTVTDTGMGMSAEVKARIFEPFFTTKEVGRGTGLGLSTVLGALQQSNGGIHVYSEPGVGTTIKVYLPAEDEPALQVHAAEAPSIRGGGETILLVEDDPAVRKLALRGLQMHGYQVISAADGQEALHLAETHPAPIDLVLTDVVMPNLSGPNLVAQLRQTSPQLRALFMSGYTDNAVVRHGLLEDSVAFIQKPFRPSALAQKVRDVLDLPGHH